MNKVCSLLPLVLITGCQQVPEKPAPAPSFLPKYHVAAPVALFSTWPGDTMSARCQQVNTTDRCMEDAIAGNEFAAILKEKNWFDDVLTESDAADYEILIASLSAQVADNDSDGVSLHSATAGLWPANTTPHYFTEFTVQWRGVEIDSQRFETYSKTEKPVTEFASEILDTWWLASLRKSVFSAEYLFTALGASDYNSELVLPQSIGEFILQDTQHYPDPFKGIISRYSHPEFDDALIDITVGPVLMDLTMPESQRLQAALEENLKEATQMSAAQGLKLITDSPVSAFTVNSASQRFNGYRMAVHAENELGEPLFATTYVFEMKDKLVTLSTTFPPRIADNLVSAALPVIEVPGESALMKTIRGMSSAQ